MLPNHYKVYVDYEMPSFADLEKEFGKRNVSDIFDGRPFDLHPSCSDIDETPGERVFFVKHFGREIESEGVINEMKYEGYRPATHAEAIVFAKAHPDLQREYPIVALGSFALYVGDRCVAVLRRSVTGRLLGGGRFDGGWSVGCRFLLVRKDTGNLGPSDTGALDAWEAERRKAWDENFNTLLLLPDSENIENAEPDAAMSVIAKYADSALAERDKRFPKPTK